MLRLIIEQTRIGNQTEGRSASVLESPIQLSCFETILSARATQPHSKCDSPAPRA
jgi:hypothetical protein